MPAVLTKRTAIVHSRRLYRRREELSETSVACGRASKILVAGRDGSVKPTRVLLVERLQKLSARAHS